MFPESAEVTFCLPPPETETAGGRGPYLNKVAAPCTPLPFSLVSIEAHVFDNLITNESSCLTEECEVQATSLQAIGT